MLRRTWAIQRGIRVESNTGLVRECYLRETLADAVT